MIAAYNYKHRRINSSVREIRFEKRKICLKFLKTPEHNSEIDKVVDLPSEQSQVDEKEQPRHDEVATSNELLLKPIIVEIESTSPPQQYIIPKNEKTTEKHSNNERIESQVTFKKISEHRYMILENKEGQIDKNGEASNHKASGSKEGRNDVTDYDSPPKPIKIELCSFMPLFYTNEEYNVTKEEIINDGEEVTKKLTDKESVILKKKFNRSSKNKIVLLGDEKFRFVSATHQIFYPWTKPNEDFYSLKYRLQTFSSQCKAIVFNHGSFATRATSKELNRILDDIKHLSSAFFLKGGKFSVPIFHLACPISRLEKKRNIIRHINKAISKYFEQIPHPDYILKRGHYENQDRERILQYIDEEVNRRIL